MYNTFAKHAAASGWPEYSGSRDETFKVTKAVIVGLGIPSRNPATRMRTGWFGPPVGAKVTDGGSMVNAGYVIKDPLAAPVQAFTVVLTRVVLEDLNVTVTG